MSENGAQYRYDVAFSFLKDDLKTAHELSELLPGLEVFIYDRYQEELLGGDGMDEFTDVFAHTARLAVILYRELWGNTPWTSVEELAIKGRAFSERSRNDMFVRLDKSPLPMWVPDTHIYASVDVDSPEGMAGAIRMRARQQGAVVRKMSASEEAVAEVRAARRKREREIREQSRDALDELWTEGERLVELLLEHVEKITAEENDYPVRVGSYKANCVLTGGGVATSVHLERHHYVDSPHRFVLRVNDWAGGHAMPTASNPTPGGGKHLSATHDTPRLSERDEWVWTHDPKLDRLAAGPVFLSPRVDEFTTVGLADDIIRRHTERLLSR